MSQEIRSSRHNELKIKIFYFANGAMISERQIIEEYKFLEGCPLKNGSVIERVIAAKEHMQKLYLLVEWKSPSGRLHEIYIEAPRFTKGTLTALEKKP
jgi:hypothetical protein